MKIRAEGPDRYAEIKVTTSTYCQACLKNFEGPEIVFYAWLDNAIICKECSKVHQLLKLRLYTGEE